MIYTHGFLPQQQCMTSHLPAPVFPVHTPCTPAHTPYAVNSCHNHFNSCHNYYEVYHKDCDTLGLVY